MLNLSFFKRKPVGEVAPPINTGTRCHCPGCDNLATDQWKLNICALGEAGIYPGWLPVCLECDIKVNRTIAELFHGSHYDNELMVYEESRRKRV